MAIPGQGYRTLGAELLALAVITGAGLYVLDRRAKASRSNQAIAQVLEAVTPNAVTSVLLLAAGIILVLGVSAGLYVLVAPVLTALVGGVVSAWLFPDQGHWIAGPRTVSGRRRPCSPRHGAHRRLASGC
jgi:hypothetical protein